MFYIIGGAPRSGKSLLALRMVKERGVPYFPTDALIGTLGRVAPEHQINHDVAFIEKARRVWKFIEHLFTHFLSEEESYLVEGDCILPEHVAAFIKKHTTGVRACFLGYGNIDVNTKLSFVRKYNRGDIDWTNEQSDEEMMPMIGRMIEYSHYLEKECKENNIKYFDVSENFELGWQQAYDYLVSEGK